MLDFILKKLENNIRKIRVKIDKADPDLKILGAKTHSQQVLCHLLLQITD